MSSAQNSVLALAALFLAVAAPAPAEAVDRSLCAKDGVTEVPGFADGRDSSKCLMVDPGNGDAAVPFQFEYMHKAGTQECKGSKVALPDLTRPFDGKRCTDFSNQSCTYLYYDVTVDNYLDRECKNKDGIFMPGGMKAKYLYFKNSRILNTWKCAAGGGWSGPNGIGCGSGEDSTSHTDGIQMRGLPGDGGWAVFQDTVFVNGHNLHFLQQTDSQFGKGSLLFQGGVFGRLQSAGEATRYIDDCRARGVSSNEICAEGRTLLDTDMNELWFVAVNGTARFNLKGNYGKVVVVAPPKFASDGSPWPLDGATGGNGTCPNGPIAKELGGPGAAAAYCYTSIERALAGGHKAPPFLHLSTAGWANPPDGVTATRPNPPTLLD